jgi:hypothetical protein
VKNEKPERWIIIAAYAIPALVHAVLAVVVTAILMPLLHWAVAMFVACVVVQVCLMVLLED